jgi:hypothetical protein
MPIDFARTIAGELAHPIPDAMVTPASNTYYFRPMIIS